MRTVANGQPLSVGEVKVLIGITRLVAELGDPALRGRSWAVVNGLLGLHLSDGQFEVLVGITDLIAALDNPALRLTKDFIQRAHRIHFEHARDRVVTDVQPVLVELEKLRILRRESGQEPTTYQVRPPDEWLARPILSARATAALIAEILANSSAQVGRLLPPLRPRPR